MNTTLQTKLDVLNHALGLLGEVAVNSFDTDTGIVPETTAGEKMSVFYNEVVDEVQQSFFWQELITSVVLTPEVTNDTFGREVYDLSGLTDCLRPLGVMATSVNATTVTGVQTANRLSRHPQDSNVKYTIAGDKLYTIADEIEFSYVKREVLPANWSSELGRSIYYNLAVMSAHTVTNDPNLINMLFQKYETFIKPTQELIQVGYKTNDQNMVNRNGMVPRAQLTQQSNQQ